ncbi:MAG TPA: hypothetical protein VHP33_38395 [Polyangiaceae bacterium]|nr:hypothetical protein [Polyangiaceae bacterium]
MVDAPRLSRQGFAAFALIWLTAVARPASGQTTEATRAAARQLATEGVAKFEEGEFVSASDKLGRAFETIRAPSLGLWSARALVRCGRLVEGGERYLEVTRLDPKTGDEAVQRQAQSDAIHEYDALQSRIPRLTLALSNSVPDQDLRVTLDGVLLPATLLRAQVPVDPGPHVIEASQGVLRAKQAILVAEGARINVSLQLAYTPEAESGAQLGLGGSTATAPGNAAQPMALPAPPAGAPGRRIPTAFWLTLAGAGTGLVVGTVTGVMAMNERAPVAPKCPGDVCDPKYTREVERLNTLRYVSTGAFAIGGVALGAAGAWWLFAPAARPAQAYVRPRIGLGHVRLEGAF